VDLALAPSLVLGEALLKNGIEAFVHDPLFAPEIIPSFVSGLRPLDLDAIREKNGFCPEDALILMTPHRYYLEFTQKDIDNKIDGKVGLILDNTGAWGHFRFSPSTQYHVVGGGTLDINV
jgi:hypothetical protein